MKAITAKSCYSYFQHWQGQARENVSIWRKYFAITRACSCSKKLLPLMLTLAKYNQERQCVGIWVNYSTITILLAPRVETKSCYYYCQFWQVTIKRVGKCAYSKLLSHNYLTCSQSHNKKLLPLLSILTSYNPEVWFG